VIDDIIERQKNLTKNRQMDVLVYLGVGFIVGSAAGIGASQHLREKQMRQHQVYLEQVLQEANYNLDRNFDLRLEKSISHLQDEQQQKYHLYDEHLKAQESRLQSQIVTWQSDYQSYVQQELSNSNDQQNTHLQAVIQSLQDDYDNQLKKLVSDWKKSQNARLQEWERRLNIRLEDFTQQNDGKLQSALDILQNQRGGSVLEELSKVEKVYETRLQDQINLLRQEYDRKLQEQVIGLTDRFNDKYNNWQSTWQNTWQNSFSAWEAKQDIKLQQSIQQVEENYQGRIGELIKSFQQEQQIQLKQTQAQLEENYQERLQASLTILQTEYEEHIRQLLEQRAVISTASPVTSNISDISHTIEGYQLAQELPADQLHDVNSSNNLNHSNNSNHYHNSDSLDNNLNNNLDDQTITYSDSLDQTVRNNIIYGDNLADQLVNPTPVDWEEIEPTSSKLVNEVNDQNSNLANPDYITNGTNGNYVNGVNSVNGVNNTNGKYYSNGTNGTNGTNGNNSIGINIGQLTPIISDTGESTVLTPSLSAISRDEGSNSYENVLVKSPELDSNSINGINSTNGIIHGDFNNLNNSLNTAETTTATTEIVNNNDNDYPLILLFTRLILFVGICGIVLDNVKKETEQEKQCDVPSLPIDLI
jgi:gas vesicle protein